jgi:hypothetical protein
MSAEQADGEGGKRIKENDIVGGGLVMISGT